MRKARKGPLVAAGKYWAAYGALPALLRSPYFHVAVVVGACCLPWVLSGGDWSAKIFSVVPNLIGFSLGGFAILLALGSDKFQSVLARAGGPRKPVLVSISTSFVHFIFVQAHALLFAIVCDGLWPALKVLLKAASDDHWKQMSTGITAIAGFIGCTLLAYSITALLAATLRIYRLVGDFVRMVQLGKPIQNTTVKSEKNRRRKRRR